MKSAPVPEDLASLATAIRACRVCRDAPFAGPVLPQEPRPILRVDPRAKILIASQAPGIRAHNGDKPFLDPSGDRLRDWLELDHDRFYDGSKILIAPMGFCFPGHTADKGDLPPRKECARIWHDRLFAAMPQVELVLAIGRYAQLYHYRRLARPLPPALTLDTLVRDWRSYSEGEPTIMALPHPSWRNSGWLKRNPWFAEEVLPALRAAVAERM